jgi:dipeptidyl aminopeptidase/acylaminoacyl peptidase
MLLPSTASVSPSTSPVPSPTAELLEDVSSPDGVIVYLAGAFWEGLGTLYAIWPDGTHRHRVVPDPLFRFVVSPDGRRVLVEGFHAGKKAIVNLDGSGYSELRLADPTLHSEFYAWSADGSRLLFHGWNDTQGGLFSVANDGSDLRKVSDDGFIAEAPDGRRRLFFRGGDLFVERMDGSQRTKLNPPSTAIFTEDDTPGAPRADEPFIRVAAWSPDGKRIAFAAFDTSATRGFDRTRAAIYVIDADGSNRQRITPVGVSLCSCLQWSPDGTWIATSAGDNLVGREQVVLVRPDGTDFHQVTSLPMPGSCCAVWAPEGTRFIAYDLRIFKVDGGGMLALGDDAGVNSYAYAWLP